MKLLARFGADDSGATAIEYGIIVALLALAILAAVQTIGISMNAMFERFSNFLANA